MAVENLTVVIADRLLREHNVNRLAELGTALSGTLVGADDARTACRGALFLLAVAEARLRRSEPRILLVAAVEMPLSRGRGASLLGVVDEAAAEGCQRRPQAPLIRC